MIPTYMLTLLHGHAGLRASTTLQGQDLRSWLCRKGYRKHHMEQIQWHLHLPADSPVQDPYHEGHFEEMKRDYAKLRLLDLLDATLLHKILGQVDRTTGAIKSRDPTVIQTLDKKMQLNQELCKHDSHARRTIFPLRNVIPSAGID